jgi:hypothetical protein
MDMFASTRKEIANAYFRGHYAQKIMHGSLSYHRSGYNRLP